MESNNTNSDDIYSDNTNNLIIDDTNMSNVVTDNVVMDNVVTDNDIIFNSPYFSDNMTNSVDQLDFQLENVTEQKTSIQHMKELIPTKKKHIEYLLNTYKYCFPNNDVKFQNEYNEDVLINDIRNTSTTNLQELISNEVEKSRKQIDHDIKFFSRIAKIPIFIDLAFVYFIWQYDANAPVWKLPNLFKFHLISDVLNTKHTKLYEYFMECITNPFMKELMCEEPPLQMRTELSEKDIENKINEEVKPLCKKILKEILTEKNNINVIQNYSEIDNSEYNLETTELCNKKIKQ